MDRRLNRAFDNMTMPEDCSQRIEKALRREMRRKARQTPRTENSKQDIQVYRPAPRRSAWAAAAVLVCLVLVLSVGGVGLFLKLPQMAQQPVQASQPEGKLELTEEGKAFLQKMCFYMPDWSGINALDNQFWLEFLLNSFTSPQLVDSGRAMTVAGEVLYENGTALVPREMAERYAALAMGMALPEFETDIYYDGIYHVPSSDFGSVGYTFQDWEALPTENGQERFGRVSFVCYVDEPENTVAYIHFTIAYADNANGFTIIGKATEAIVRDPYAGTYRQENAEAELVIQAGDSGTYFLEIAVQDAEPLSCVGYENGGKLWFYECSGEEDPVYGIVSVTDSDASVTVMGDTNWLDTYGVLQYQKTRSMPQIGWMEDAVEDAACIGKWQQAEAFALSFTQNWLLGDIEAVKAKMTERTQWNLVIYREGSGSDAVVLGAKASATRIQPFADGFTVSVTFKTAQTADYQLYLTVELVEYADGFRVREYWLEM